MLKKCIVFFIVCVVTQPYGRCQISEEKLSAERAVVEAKLAGLPNQVILAVNGLHCANCAIGIGKKVCKLDFIDIDALPNGVKVDRKNALLMVAVKQKEKIDIAALADAIRKAGYDPVRLYQRIENGSLKVIGISED